MEYKKQKGKTVELQGEFKKLRPLMFDGGFEEAVEAWFLNIKIFFQIYSYDDNLRARLGIFQLSGKVALWWKEAKSVNNIRSKELRWKLSKKLFKNKDMLE